MASLSDEVLRPFFALDEPEIVAESPAYTPETAPTASIKKSKKKKKVKGALRGEDYTRISELGDLNGIETPLPRIDMILEPGEEPLPQVVAVPEEETLPKSEVIPEPVSVPEGEAVTQEQQHLEYGHDDSMRQNDEIAESTVTGEEEVTPSPLYLPFSAQHRLMVHLQHKLEAICFSFGQKHMPEKLRTEGWDCPEAVELNVWTNEFREARPFKERVPKRRRSALLDQVANIRNYAVSRTRIDFAELRNALSAAVHLAILLGEDWSMFGKLREEVVSTNKWLAEEKEQLQKRLDAKLGVIAAARAKVDTLEEVTRAAFDKGLLKRQNMAHAKILMAIEKVEADQLVEVTDCSVTPSSLDWVNGLENSLMLGDDSQEESWT
ncbi:hypothetical protein DER45DRAFT_570892 [Fusarium avenaceum]|nr:hypothetical protein DER45DRAFT_570892 [Fusarium avenaceum]